MQYIFRFLFNIIRLPVDLVFLTFDCFRAANLYFSRKFHGGQLPCVFCHDEIKTNVYPRPCKSANKYGNLWIFKAVCPCAREIAEECPVRHCRAEYSVQSTVWHAPWLALLLLAGWLGMLGAGLLHYFPKSLERVMSERPHLDPGMETPHPVHTNISDDPAVLLSEGRAYLSQGKFKYAEYKVMDALKHSPDDPEAHDILGQCLAQREAWVEAAQAFKKSLQLDPDQKEVFLRLAECQLQAGNYDEALMSVNTRIGALGHTSATDLIKSETLLHLDRTEEAKPLLERLREKIGDDPENMRRIARLHSQAELWPEAEKIYEMVTINNPKDIGANIGLAHALWKQEKVAAAIRQLTQAQGNLLDDPAVLVKLGEIYVAEKQVDLAIEAYQRAMAKDPGNGHRALETATLLKRAGRIEEARDLVQAQLSQQDPTLRLEGLVQLAQMALDAKQYEIAFEYAQQAFAIEANMAEAHRIAAIALQSVHNYKKAMHHLRIYLSQTPDDLEAQLTLGKLNLEFGNSYQGLLQFEEAAKRHPASGEANLCLADWYFAEGQNTLAIKNYEEALRRKTENPLAINNLSRLLIAKGDYERAFDLIYPLAQQYDRNPLFMDALGWILIHRNKLENGLSLLKYAAQTEPGNGTYRYHYGAALSKAGDPKSALFELQAALDSGKHFPEYDDAKTLWLEIELKLGKKP